MSDDVLWEDGGSIFRPSYSATWLNCLGSLLPSRFASDTSGEDAAIGTVFHLVMKEWLLVARPDHWSGEIIVVEKEDGSEKFDVEVDEDMFVFGQDCIDFLAQFTGTRYVETRVDISALTPIPKQGGTADVAFCNPGLLDIIDWKYGRGVQVFAKKNTQELLYASGFFRQYDHIYHFERIRLWIAQPRLRHWDCWEISRQELLDWMDWAKGRAFRAWKRGAPRSPSPKACQWCKIRVGCAALEAARQAITDQSFDDLEEMEVTEHQMKAIVTAGSPPPAKRLPDPSSMPTAQLAQIYDYRKLMESWFSDIGTELIARGLDGDEGLKGRWKVVPGRSRRKYRDEDRAVEMYRKLGLDDDDIFIQKLASPNQLKTVLRSIGVRGKLQEAFIKLLVYFPPGKPTLAPDGDNRLAIPNPADVFEDETEDGDEL